MTTFKTPGVYVEEKNSFGSSIVANETAIPVFIGFTQKMTKSNGEELNFIKGSDSVREPVMVSSMLEYEQTFGYEDTTGIISVMQVVETTSDPVSYVATNQKVNSSSGELEPYTPGLIYPSVSNFFGNGGGSCYIVAIGNYNDFTTENQDAVNIDFIEEAIELAKDATLILPTDLIRYGETYYYTWGTKFVNFAQVEKKYFCVLDVIQSDPLDPVYNKEDISAYREAVTPDYPSYAGAYFPYLKSLTNYAYNPDLTGVLLNGYNLGTDEVVEYAFAGTYDNETNVLFSLVFASQNEVAPIIGDVTLTTTDGNDISIDPDTNTLTITYVEGSTAADFNAIWSGKSEGYPEWSLNFLLPLEEDGTTILIQEGVWETISIDSSDGETELFPFILDFDALSIDPTSGTLIESITCSVVVSDEDATETTVVVDNTASPMTAIITIPVDSTASAAVAVYKPEDTGEALSFTLSATNTTSEDTIDTDVAAVALDLLHEPPNNATVEEVKTFLASNYINMPPSPFMAGIYSRLDSATGVWTPPANTSPIGVTGPLVPITSKQQEDLNVDATSGKSINAIRSFTGKGTLVWGARTNDGNSMDWRYVNVRRLFISMETDISMALEAYVFKPNVHNTWVEVKTMIESYLFGLFNDGAFAGTTPEGSYQVLIGIGETMTDEDVLNGYMRASILVAPVRPAEFIVLTFSQMVGV